MKYSSLLLLAVCLAGCGAFRAHNIPETTSLAKSNHVNAKTKIYVQETLKPQDSGEFCYEWHGCLWHGKNSFGERLAYQFTQAGASSYFVGLSRQERFDSSQRGDNMAASQVDVTTVSPYRKKLETNQSIKNSLKPDEYWIDSKIRFTSNSAGEWFAKSLLSGFTLTMVPVWQEISTEVDLTVTNSKQKEIWSKKYKDSYTGLVWFFLFPMASTMSSVPDDVTENMARAAVNEMIKEGVITYKE